VKRFFDWVSLVEGQALRVSSDMEAFAKEAISDLMRGEWQYGHPAYERDVDSKYGVRHIKIIPAERPEGDKGMGVADYMKGEIEIYVKPGWNMGDGFVDFVIHELVHMFDPKLNHPKLAGAKWGIDSYVAAGKPLNLTGDDEKDKIYYLNPWEQDAFMAQNARERIRLKLWFFDGDMAAARKSIASLQPETDWEWFAYQDKKVWKKYLNTIYQGLEKVRDK
jgi:hypothetical protein